MMFSSSGTAKSKADSIWPSLARISLRFTNTSFSATVYVADKYDSRMRERIKAGAGAGLRIGRDVRMFLIFLGAVTNCVLPVLVMIAVVMNFETMRRVRVAGVD